MKRIHDFSLIIALIILLTHSVFAQQELKICALRVSFQEDQNSLTTGNGLFLTDTSGVDQFTVDPPPHNRSYFQDQIIAVNNYFLAASRGHLNISGEVFPLSQNNSYQLPNEMNYYNPNTTDDENDRRLAQLLIDAVQLADMDADIDFSQYDVVTIFHAGVGKDIDVGFDETPQDIPSLYLSLEFFKKALGDTFSGISVDNGNVLIENGIILPETESQVDYQLALTGIFASNIASHLGLLDLFSATEQVTGIGQFGLMDVGQFNVFGLVPAIPCAFSRALAGWDTPLDITTPQSSIQVNQFKGELTQNNSIVKIPINSDEYYLLEFRGERTINIDSVYFAISENSSEFPTYLEVLSTYLPNRITVSDSTGVLLKVDDYDWGLPGAGILIWHIDEQVIAEKGETNRINDDPENRGVDLEEADGSQDIGFTYDITQPGYQSELGTWLDFWFDLSKYRPLYKNEFSPSSSPNTRSNQNYANTHIVLDNFSKNYGDVMTFDYSRDFHEVGFPVSLSNNENSKFCFLKGAKYSANTSAIFSSDDEGNIYAVTSEGKGIFSDSSYIIAQLPGVEEVDFVLGDSNSDEIYDKLIASNKSGFIAGFDLVDANTDLLADTLFTLNLGVEIINQPVIQGQYFYITTIEDSIRQYSFSGDFEAGTLLSSINSNVVITGGLRDIVFSSSSVFGPIVVDINTDGIVDKIFFPDSNTIEIDFSNGDIQKYFTDYKMTGLPSVADVDLDGYYEIIYNSKNLINAINYNNSQVTNMPFKPVLIENENLIGTPLIADINNDDIVDIISITNQGQLFAYDSNGDLLNGFPLSAGGNVSDSPLLIDIDNDANLELFTINQNGDINGWQFDEGFSIDNLWWTQQFYSPENNLYLTKHLMPVIPGFSELLPARKVYNYPNPNIDDFTNIRYFLTEEANVNIKIFDLGGDIVDSFNGPGNSGVDQQIEWNVSDIESGVYLCRIEAKSASKSDVRIIKIMVIH
ncbi:MAG: T9SS type A sorting domain-containing protein [Calditrichia bacterium]|nr:T9SS type A sorting domain-containing protein [Calditrichia bacterium]